MKTSKIWYSARNSRWSQQGRVCGSATGLDAWDRVTFRHSQAAALPGSALRAHEAESRRGEDVALEAPCGPRRCQCKQMLGTWFSW